MNENKKGIRSNLAKVDAHVITEAEYAEIPELDDDFFDKADQHIGSVLVKRGRPVGSSKTQMNLRIDNDLIDACKR